LTRILKSQRVMKQQPFSVPSDFTTRPSFIYLIYNLLPATTVCGFLRCDGEYISGGVTFSGAFRLY
jgi:hypothetical protein